MGPRNLHFKQGREGMLMSGGPQIGKDWECPGKEWVPLGQVLCIPALLRMSPTCLLAFMSFGWIGGQAEMGKAVRKGSKKVGSLFRRNVVVGQWVVTAKRTQGLSVRVGLRDERLRSQGGRGRERPPWRRLERHRGSSKGKVMHTAPIIYLIHGSELGTRAPSHMWGDGSWHG